MLYVDARLIHIISLNIGFVFARMLNKELHSLLTTLVIVSDVVISFNPTQNLREHYNKNVSREN